MKQRHWLELLKDYNLQIQYQPGKANVMVDALSRKTQHSLNTIAMTQLNLLKELEYSVSVIWASKCSVVNAYLTALYNGGNMTEPRK